MKPDFMDLQVESRGDDVDISLSGSFGYDQFPAFRDKLGMLVNGPGCFFFLNIQNAHFTDERYLNFFLELLNLCKKKKSALIFIFSSRELHQYFSKYRNLFEIADSRAAYKKSGTRKQLEQLGIHYGHKSGISLSPGVAVVLMTVFFGWILTLYVMISTQGRELSEKQAQIITLQNQKDLYIREIDKLEASIGPLRKLGVMQDTTRLNSFGLVKDWVGYLEYLENSRREK